MGSGKETAYYKVVINWLVERCIPSATDQFKGSA